MKRHLRTLILTFALTACATTNHQLPMASKDPIDILAQDYVKLSLEIGAQEEGYIDAYYGPADLQPKPDAPKRDRKALIAATRALSAQISAIESQASDVWEQRRINMLLGQLRAAEARLMMADGIRFSFAEEAERLFGVKPVLKPLTSYDADLAALDALVPGKGTLAERVDAAQDAAIIPTSRLKPVFDAAIAECRKRTMAHIALPPSETFTLEFVTGKSWGGYNYYQGGYNSLIQVNTDLPIRLPRAIDLGCHEGYPGHHALNMLLEEKLSKGRGWQEFSVYPLYSPQSLIAEGSANYGIDLAFPGADKLAYERSVLAPLAGLSREIITRNAALQDRLKVLSGARLTIAQMLLDGEIDRDAAIKLSQKYLLLSRARAEKSVAFTEQYRSYVINYGLGQDMVRDFVEAGNADIATKWRRMESVISEPTVPADLLP